MVKKVKNKVVRSGKIVEILEYEHGYWMGYELTEDETEKQDISAFVENTYKFYQHIKIDEALEKVIASEIESKAKESMKKSVNRAKTKLRRLIEQNRGKYKQRDKFITLTIAENETNRKDTNYDFMKFIQWLKSRYSAFEYIAVLEKQKRGSIHYHVLFFGLPYIPNKELEKLWGKGFVRINVIDTYPELGKYLVKYLSKDLETGRATKQKRYFTSRGLIQPVEEFNVDLERIVEDEDLKIQFIKEFENEYVGKGHMFIAINKNINYLLTLKVKSDNIENTSGGTH